jgi:hypothetical protein
MTSTQKGVRQLYNPYTQYNFSNPSANTWTSATFVDGTQSGDCTLAFTIPQSQTQIRGHLVVPIIKSTAQNQFYSRAGPFNSLTPQSNTTINTENQVTYVPAGQPFVIKGPSKPVNLSVSLGYVVLPLGETNYNYNRFNSAEADPNYNNYMYVRD